MNSDENRTIGHSQEPWINCGNHIDDANGGTILKLFGSLERINCHDVKRAVACVNFLRGVPTEELERILKCGLAFRTLPGIAVDALHGGYAVEQRHLDDYAEPPAEAGEGA